MSPNENNHPFDTAIRLTGEGDRYSGHTTEHYANMIGPFGGIIAAVMQKAILSHTSRLGDPVAFTVNYAAPISNGAFEIVTRLVRNNRSTQHWSVELLQQEHVCATATAVLATRRDTWSSTDLPFPEVPDIDKAVKVSGEGFPSWVYRYDIRMVRGGFPPFISIENEKAYASSVTIQWVRDEPRRPMDFPSLTALCDSFFPRIFIRRDRIVPVGTVSFTVYYHADADALHEAGDREMVAGARANRFFKNYFDQTAELWTPEGILLATSSQIYYYKE